MSQNLKCFPPPTSLAMSLVEQILQSHISQGLNNPKKSGSNISAGEIVECDIDYIMVHEQLGGRIAPEYDRLGLKDLPFRDRILFILDHWVPPPDVKAAKMHQRANNFADKYNFKWNLGQNRGICHQVIPEMGFARPGRLIVGSDSHTTTYGAFNCFSTGIGASDVINVFATKQLWFKVPETRRIEFVGHFPENIMAKDLVLSLMQLYGESGAIYDSFEFGGSGLKNISIDGRMSISNMVVEMGAKSGIFEYDKVLEQWLSIHADPEPDIIPKYKPVIPKHPTYIEERTIDLSDLDCMVAKPFSPANVSRVDELNHIEIDEAFLGSCTNGRLEDLQVSAKLLKGHKIPNHVKFIVIPASREIYLEAMREGLLEIFIQAGAVVEYPSCGPCIGGHLGVLGPNEVCVSSSNRNFKGRMGDPSSQSYLASPLVVTASAINGYLTHPKEVKL